MTLPPPNICRKIRKLFALVGSSNAKEAESARAKLTKLLDEHGCSWNDLPTILAAVDPATGTAGTASTHASSSTSATEATNDSVNVLDLVMRLIEEHVAVNPAECMVAALWLLHTYVFDQFAVTPRLAIVSPARGCGKSTLVELLELLSAEPFKVDDVSAAAIYHQLDHRPRTTLLIDEADNLGLLNNRVLRAVFNSGHRRGGGIARFVSGWTRKFPTFAPLAVAAIGATKTLPLPLLHRSIIINMQRFAPSEDRPGLSPLDQFDPAFAVARVEIGKWAATCQLARDPEMPSRLRNRAADNWRALLAIADALGHGETARAAAIELNSDRPDEDAVVTLLDNIRAVFLACGVDRIFSAALVKALVALDDGDWSEWRGPNCDRPPHRLTQSELAVMLRRFGIKPKTIWPNWRGPGDRSARGYERAQFEAAWAAYCTSADTPTQPSKIIHLLRP